ncbi:hypothetical protein AAG570_004443 [Ranatra chinensis]|uniref:RING-type E3 ubiquitin-protein ligase PPIL2 n=1 Tax=Ranatra chinensis TaxID=642074 RepID=A0ABD0Y373_9HEMI
MGKRQHQKDKMYITYTEWATLYGGKKHGPEEKFKKLPFDHCCLSLQPFKNPCCDKDGNIFDLEAVALFLKKFKINPVTGKPQDFKSLIKLNFSKDREGKYHCPVLFKEFTPGSQIVAIAVTGNVFSYEAVEQLNIKNKSMKDLITGDPFTKSDLIELQHPHRLEKFNLVNFHHIRNGLVVEEPGDEEDSGSRKNLKTISKEAQAILDELDRDFKFEAKGKAEKPVADKFNAAHYSTLVTNLGPLNLELHCDLTPKTCENFIKLSQRGYYDNTVFHRSIRHFMIQGGDPTGTGTGGDSIWSKAFEDEIKPQLTHSGRGVLSMANSGPNTNTSQFFITYRSCPNLNNKHTVFGRVVGGLDTLSAMEKIEVDNKDRPIEDIVVLATHVFVDPYQEADDRLVAERAAAQAAAGQDSAPAKPPTALRPFRAGVGKYISPAVIQTSKQTAQQQPLGKKQKPAGYQFKTFDNW